MRVKIMDYEVDVNCKEWFDSGYNEKATLNF